MRKGWDYEYVRDDRNSFERDGKALNEAVDKGIKYGLKTGEIVQNEEMELELAEE